MIPDRIGRRKGLLEIYYKITVSENEGKNKQNRYILFKELLPQFLSDLLLLVIVTIFLLLIGQKARTSGCDWFIQLSENRCPIRALCYWSLFNKWFCCQIKENRVLNIMSQ